MVTERTTHAGAEQVKPLSGNERRRFPHTIYGQHLPRGADHSLFIASFETLQQAEFPLAIDRERTRGQDIVTMRTRTSHPADQRFETVMIMGLTEAARKKLAAEEREKKAGAPEGRKQAARRVTDALYAEFAGKEQVYAEYKEAQSSFMLGLSGERFVNTLFTQGTEYDPELIADNLTGSTLTSVAYHLGMGYQETSGWYKKTPEEIVAEHPEIDHRQLEDDAFRETDEGKALESAYAEISGEILARRAHDPKIKLAKDGSRISTPMIPLTKYPLIEAVVTVEMQTHEMTPNILRNDYCELTIRSDSKEAHDALVWRLTTPYPRPDNDMLLREFADEYKRKSIVIQDIIHRYNNINTSADHRALLKDDLLGLLDFYTGDNDVTQRLRADGIRARERDYFTHDVSTVKEIISSIVTTALASPDPDLSGKAEQLIDGYLIMVPARRGEPDTSDPLALTRTDIVLALFDGMKHITEDSRPEIFGRVAEKVFGNPMIGERFEDLAALQVRGAQIAWSNEVGLKRREYFKYDIFDDTQSGEKDAAKVAFQRAVAPAEELHRQHSAEKNQMIIGMLEQMVGSGHAINASREYARMFRELVTRVEFSTYQATELPPEYSALMNIAKRPDLGSAQKSTLLWHMSGKLHFTSGDAERLLIPVVVDMFEAILGPVDHIQVPDSEGQTGLAAAESVVRNNPRMFHGVSYEDLEALLAYKSAIAIHLDRIIGGNKLPSHEAGTGGLMTMRDAAEGFVSFLDDQREEIRAWQRVTQTVDAIEEEYEEHLHLEEVKRKPHVYYPWVLREMRSFIGGMEWEMGPGQRPSTELRALYSAMRLHIEQRFAYRDSYTEEFDPMEEGAIDSWLREGYYRMVVYSELHYNNTVWQKGLPFMSMAMRYMPDSLLARMAAEYQGEDFGEYLAKEQRRRREDDERIH